MPEFNNGISRIFRPLVGTLLEASSNRRTNAVSPGALNNLESGKDERLFNFADIQAKAVLSFRVPGGPTVVDLPGLSVISLSRHRDVYPVTSSGRSGIKGWTTGHSLVAGTLGFTVLSRQPFLDMMQLYAHWIGAPLRLFYMSPDQLPPFDLNLVFVSDRGHVSQSVIRSLKIVDQSINLNTQDPLTTEAYAFEAAAMSIIAPMELDEKEELMDRIKARSQTLTIEDPYTVPSKDDALFWPPEDGDPGVTNQPPDLSDPTISNYFQEKSPPSF